MKLPVIRNSPSAACCSVNRSASLSSRPRGSALQSNKQACPSKKTPGEKANVSDARTARFCSVQGITYTPPGSLQAVNGRFDSSHGRNNIWPCRKEPGSSDIFCTNPTCQS